jgi:uncharacterized membrane-anchored protein
MLKKRRLILAALIWPLLLWCLLVGHKTYISLAGASIILPISGYDPRDLLVGHYLTYRVDYGLDEQDCNYYDARYEVYVINPGRQGAYVTRARPADEGELFIAGACDHGFKAGIERFYVPEKDALLLDRILRRGLLPASIEVGVTAEGRAQVRELLLNNKPWRQALEEIPAAED